MILSNNRPRLGRVRGRIVDAYCTFVVDVDNQGHVAARTTRPAPQLGDPDHYDTFLKRICRFYSERYGDLANLPAVKGLSVEDALSEFARSHPGLLKEVG